MRLELRGGEGAGPPLSIWAQKSESLETRWYPLSARQDVRGGQGRAGTRLEGLEKARQQEECGPQPREGSFVLCCQPAPQPLRPVSARAGGQLGAEAHRLVHF